MSQSGVCVRRPISPNGWVALAVAGLALPAARPALAQDYLLRLDARAQTVSYRGVRLDSIPIGQAVPAASGGLESPDGFAVSCAAGASYCQFYRPGPEQNGGPLVTTADLTAWGFGVPGLSLHANARLGLDLGDSDVWPGTNPATQLHEAYAEYATDRFTGRLGRQTERGRLGYTGFDGGRATWRLPAAGLSASAYGGLGLSRGSALPVTSAALNPLDDFQPRERQLVVGAGVEWQADLVEARAEYQREVDRDTRNFVSERAALSATFRPLLGWSLTGGAEYDFSREWFGTADLSLRHTRERVGGAVGIRRYRPYFDLWTLWGVFSPVPYSAYNGSLWVTPVRGLELRAGGERYRYDESGALTPLVSEEREGWRWNAGAGYAAGSRWSADLGYHAEFGPGAASRGWEASVSWRATVALTLTAEAGHLARPLEFRYSDASLDWGGLSAELRPSDRLRLTAGLVRYQEDRRRPDAAEFDWSQTRLRAGLSWLLGSSADRMPLPPARRREGR